MEYQLAGESISSLRYAFDGEVYSDRLDGTKGYAAPQMHELTFTGLSGLLLEPDASAALDLRKYALTMGTLLRSYSYPEEILSKMRNDGAEFVLVNYDASSTVSSDLIRDITRHFPGVPVLAILPVGADEALKQEAIHSGVWDFFVRPFGIGEYQMRLRNVLKVKQVPTSQIDDALSREGEIRAAIGDILLREFETLYVLGKAAEYKDEDTGSHIARVANYARLISRMIGESENAQDLIYHSSALHDIGKIGIPDSILLKPARLDEPELVVMRTHTTNGHGILEHSASSYLLTGAMIALTHHERFDGGGYPMQLSKTEIPLYGRIVCIADVFDALTTRRPYKEPWSLDRAFTLLTEERGKQFDPDLVDAFVYNSQSVERIFRDHTDQ